MRSSAQGFILGLILALAYQLLNGGKSCGAEKLQFPSSRGRDPSLLRKANGHSGVGGVEFEVLPIGVDVPCDSVVLRGTGKHQGSAYLLPNAYLTVGPGNNSFFKVKKNEHGKYQLALGLFFPRESDEIRVRQRGDRLNYQYRGCNTVTVLEHVNKGKAESDPSRIQRLVSLPVSQIKASVEGLSDVYIVGSQETNLLRYQGVDHKISFTIPDERALKAIYREIGDRDGLGLRIKIDIIFMAQKAEGYQRFQIQLDKVAADLQTALGAQDPKKLVFSAELKTALQSILSRGSVEGYSEGELDSKYEELALSIIKQVFSEANDSKLDLLPDEREEEEELSRRKRANEWGGWEIEKPKKSRQPLYRASVFVKALRESRKIDFNFTKMGSTEPYVFTTFTYLKGEIEDPANRQITVGSHQESVRVLDSLKAGEVVTIFPEAKSVEEFDHKLELTEYLTTKEIQDLKLAEYFPDRLKDSGSPLGDNVLKLGKMVAQQKRTHGFQWFDWHYYVWGQKDLVSRTKFKSSPTEIRGQELKTLPVTISFSNLGSKEFPLWMLATSMNDTENTNRELWSGTYSELGSKITFRPARDLGIVTLRNREYQSEKQRTVEKAYFQELWSQNPHKKRQQWNQVVKEILVSPRASLYQFRVKTESLRVYSPLIQPRSINFENVGRDEWSGKRIAF